MLKDWWQKIVRVDASSDEGRVVFLVMVMAVCSVFAIVVAFLLLSWAPIYALGLGWLFVAGYTVMQGSALSGAANTIGKITVPSGSSTPSVAQHSNIETLEVRGEYAKAAEAYRGVIAADLTDIVACEKLALLALRRIQDYDTAIFAYREAEKRSLEPRRQLGYAILVAGIYRDNLKDAGKAMVELRRILARYPDAPNAESLRTEIAELKATLFEGT
jgi:tetratricopeptide (TPR) repeat protein